MESASVAAPGAGRPPATGEAREGSKGLKTGALSFISNVVFGVASTAPGSVPFKLVHLSPVPTLVVPRS
jgi:hypothetical protein